MRGFGFPLCLGWIVLGASVAHATPARMVALSNNAGFIDDTDFFRYPSALAAQPSRALLNYDGGFDGGVYLDSGRAFYLQRHSVARPLPDLTLRSAEGYQALYAQAQGGSGFLIRAAQGSRSDNPDVPAFSVGGAWSNGPGRGDVQNLAVDGDLLIFNRLVGDDPDTELGVQLGVTGRNLTGDRLTLWTARLSVDTLNEVSFLHGGYTLGPRFRNEDFRAALQIGPGVNVYIPFGDNNDDAALRFDIPFGNFAGEYRLREWFVLRGSLVASWTASVQAAEDDAIDTLTFGPALGGAFGVGFSHKRAQFDMTVNPNWVLNGPNVLSGTTEQMFGVLSARVDL